MRVILLGAGASKSYDQSPTGLRMPVARDFFETFERLKVASNPWVLRESLFSYLRLIKQVDPETYLRSGVDIEDLHSEIADGLQTALSDLGDFNRVLALRPYNELLFLFACTLNEIQNGPISQSHQLIARILDPEDVIITFNWDTLLDRALANETSWRPDFGYGFTPARVFRDEWQVPERGQEPRTPTILKLHGSTNWLVGYIILDGNHIILSQEASPDQVSVFEHASRPYPTYAGRYMPGYQPYSYGYYPPSLLHDRGRRALNGRSLIRARMKVPWKPEGTAPDEGLVSMPLIIPPVKQKSYELFGDIFTMLWDQAERALRQASKILIIGYSFPRTDLRSHKLFTDAFTKRTTVPHVVIVDPVPHGVAERFRYDFGIPDSYLEVHESYFSKDFPLAQVLQGPD